QIQIAVRYLTFTAKLLLCACRSLLPGIRQSPVQGCTQLLFRHRAGKPFAVDEESWSGVNAELVTLRHGGANGSLILFLYACLKLFLIELMLLRLLFGGAVKVGKGVSARLAGHDFLIGVNVVGEVPIGLAVLLAQAIAIDGGAHGPGMDLQQRVILVHHPDSVGVVLKYISEER